MGVTEILVSIDREIALLKQVRAMLNGGAAPAPKRKAGRRKAKAAAAAIPATSVKKVAKRKKRKLSPEGRKRIAEAVRRRWEKQRKAAASSK